MAYIDFLNHLGKKTTSRDYLARVNEFPKAEAARIAKRWDFDYWDGDRKFGFGGYRDDGRWKPVAEVIAKHYGLTAGQRVLDVGCGKGFLLYELAQAVPGLKVAGIDVSAYAIEHAKEDVKPFLKVASADSLPYPDGYFDFIFSINTLHNLPAHALYAALREIVRVGNGPAWIQVESWRSEEEKANLLYWQLTCESFYSPESWEWWFRHTGYAGDHAFLYFK